jgi:hypothetical protein
MLIDIRGLGLVLRLGSNPWGRFAFVQYIWSRLEQEQYRNAGELPKAIWEIHPETPVLILSFRQFLWSHGWMPRMTIRSDLLVGDRDSLVLCSPIPVKIDLQRQHHFLIPSEDFKTKSVMARVKEKFEDGKGKIPYKRPERLQLEREYLIDAYATETHHLPTKLTEFLEQEVVEVGLGKVPVESAPHLCFAKEIIQAGLLYWKGNKQWFSG